MKIGLQGAGGRMGQEISALLRPEQLGSPEDVWIDFSRPEGTMALLAKIDKPVVIGTTGFSEAELSTIRAYAETHPVLLASNMSPGMALVRRMVRSLPVAAPKTFTAILSEAHHRHKKDAPSGTAKTLLEGLKERGFSDVAVNVTRAGEIIGTHGIDLISDEEEITITHRVSNRRVFAKGALLGAAFLVGVKKPGIYSMDDVFEGDDNE